MKRGDLARNASGGLETYRFINATRNVSLADRGRLAANAWLRFKGLLGSKSLANGEALLIRPCQSVHTLFMVYPIDVLFVNRDSRIVHLYHSLRPFRISRLVFRAKYVIELPAGTIERTHTTVGDLLRIEKL